MELKSITAHTIVHDVYIRIHGSANSFHLVICCYDWHMTLTHTRNNMLDFNRLWGRERGKGDIELQYADVCIYLKENRRTEKSDGKKKTSKYMHTRIHNTHFVVHTICFLKFLLFCIANMHFMCLYICTFVIQWMSVNK